MHILKSTDYNIYIGNDVYDEFLSTLKTESYSSIFVLIDENIRVNCLAHLNRKTSLLSDAILIEIPSGEEHKNLQTLEKIWTVLTERSADRKSLLINFGGGVIGDMGGVAASLFKRGIDYIQFPTSLLAMVDASVGGKTAVDFQNYKNILGLFSNPKAVFIDPTFLVTLDEKHMRSGYAEILKACLLDDRAYWDVMKGENFEEIKNWENFIQLALMIKNEIVYDDPLEEGKRKVLNLGHTFGHVFETFALERRMKLSHGHAVAMGLICELYLSEKLSTFSLSDRDEISAYILENYSKFEIEKEQFEILYEIMIQDKKNINQSVRMVLLEDIAKPIWDKEVHQKDIYDALEYYMSL